jgi:aminopyrrolnitrin oxygenase
MMALGPDVPRNWYLLGESSAFRRGAIVSHTVGATAMVVYRGVESGTVSAFSAHCAHMGCHLARGRVVRDTIQCGLHHRVIAADGAFTVPTGQAPSGMTQPTFPVTEYLGCVFVYLGATSAAPAPALSFTSLSDVAWHFVGEQTFPLTWQTLVANGFDVEHLAAVHDRRLLETPTLDRQSSREMQLQYRSTPTAARLSDRAMMWLAPDGIRGSIRTLGGSMMLVESTLGRHESFILMSFVPDGVGNTTIRSVAGVKRITGVRGAMAARLASALFRAFLTKDVGVLHGLQWHEPAEPKSLGDRFTVQLCDFFRELEGA